MFSVIKDVLKKTPLKCRCVGQDSKKTKWGIKQTFEYKYGI